MTNHLEEEIAEHFKSLTTAQLIRRMERASATTNLDDETFELSRRLERDGKKWRWTRDLFNPRIVVESR